MMLRTTICNASIVLGVVALGFLTAGCTEDDPCDDDQILVDGFCNPAPAPADAAIPPPTSDASVAPEVSGEAGAPSAFGKTCATSAECVAPADYCAVPPGNCTATGCELDPSICPDTWTCLDLTPFGVSLHVCVPPM